MFISSVKVIEMKTVIGRRRETKETGKKILYSTGQLLDGHGAETATALLIACSGSHDAASFTYLIFLFDDHCHDKEDFLT